VRRGDLESQSSDDKESRGTAEHVPVTGCAVPLGGETIGGEVLSGQIPGTSGRGSVDMRER
jgi:hypothetical protein